MAASPPEPLEPRCGWEFCSGSRKTYRRLPPRRLTGEGDFPSVACLELGGCWVACLLFFSLLPPPPPPYSFFLSPFVQASGWGARRGPGPRGGAERSGDPRFRPGLGMIAARSLLQGRAFAPAPGGLAARPRALRGAANKCTSGGGGGECERSVLIEQE